MNERRGPRDLFAGGEKSGLAVQDPNRNAADPQNVIKDILAKAKACVLYMIQNTNEFHADLPKQECEARYQ